MKLGSDAVGIAKGLLTLPMLVLGAGGIVAGLILALRQDWPPIRLGLIAGLLCYCLARLLEGLVIRIDDLAARALERDHRRRARVAAIVSGALPVAVVFAAEIVSLRGVLASGSTMSSPGSAFVLWLWGYGVAVGPWTLFANRVSRFRRTLVAIRAYAGHIALWLFSVLTLVRDAPPASSPRCWCCPRSCRSPSACCSRCPTATPSPMSAFDTVAMAQTRGFLFLQGPHGSFFPRLGATLVAHGHRVRRINLNGGDLATWPNGDAFRGRERGWGRYIAHYIARHRVTDLIVFGDGRPMHATAILAAKAAGVRVHVFEEGYIRPDWITLEREGVNGHSLLPRDPDWYLETARGLPPVPDNPPIPSFSTGRGWAAFFYYAEVVLQFWRFPFHRSHRDRDPVWEGITYLRRFRRRAEEAAQAATDIDRISGRPSFLFPLQLNSDYQIRVNSPFRTMQRALAVVLDSFARAAPADLALVIKEHPLDSGLTHWRTVIGDLAATFGITDRVVFVEQGDLLAMVRASRGMVVVNSTSGTIALAQGKPVKALGKPVYDIAGLTDPQPLDAFWSNPQAPVPGLYDAFYRVLADRCLIHGAFLSNAGIDLLVTESARRLTGDDVTIRPGYPRVEKRDPGQGEIDPIAGGDGLPANERGLRDHCIAVGLSVGTVERRAPDGQIDD